MEPLGLSRQFETQGDSSSKVIYVEGFFLNLKYLKFNMTWYVNYLHELGSEFLQKDEGFRYVEGGRLCSFVFKVTLSRFELKEDFPVLDIRVSLSH